MSGGDLILSGILEALVLIISGDPEVIRITSLSLQVSGSATLLGALVGFPLGTLIALKQFRGKSLFVTLTNTLMSLPPVAVGLFFYLLLSNFGPLGFLQLLYTPQAMILAQWVLILPITIGVTYAAVSNVDPKVRETAVSLGADGFLIAWTVIREARLGVVTALAVAFGAAISEVGAIMIVGGNLLGYTRALTTGIMLHTSSGDFASAIALGIILIVLAFAVNIALTLATSNSFKSMILSTRPRFKR